MNLKMLSAKWWPYCLDLNVLMAYQYIAWGALHQTSIASVHLRSPGNDFSTFYHINPKLSHWGRVTHICVGKLTIIGPDNGLSPGRRQAIIRTNAVILLIGTLRTNFSEILSEIHTFSFKKMHLKMSSVKWRPFCLGLNVLKCRQLWPQMAIMEQMEFVIVINTWKIC